MISVSRWYVLGALIIVLVVAVTYFPSVGTGLYHDDWGFLTTAGRLSLPDYLIHYFDPRVQTVWYRPLQGMMFLVEYHLFRSNFSLYHWRQILIHAVNCWLLSVIVLRLTSRWRVAILAGLLYAGLPSLSLAVNWVGVPDPLAALFYLLTVWLWVNYLQRERKGFYFLALAAWLLALMSKEITATAPIALFVLDRWWVNRRIGARTLFLRYLPFAVVLLPYAILERYIQSRGWYMVGVGFDASQIFRNLLDYLGVLAFPWTVATLFNYAFLATAFALGAYFVIRTRQKIIVGMAIIATMNILPLVGFPTWFFHPRYLYLSATVSAVVFAFLGENVAKRLGQYRGVVPAATLVLLLANSFGVADATADFADKARQSRVPFRDISQKHPTLPQNTYLYFLTPPSSMLIPDLTGIFLMRYGTTVTVDSPDSRQFARFRDYAAAYLYYFDAGRMFEVLVERETMTQATPVPLLNFAEPIRLEGYTVTRTIVKRGEGLVVLLYWRALGKIGKDYTVFAHLMDESGSVIAGYDSQPWQGYAPTSTWRAGELIVDAVVIPTDEVPPNLKYHLGIGLYDLSTMERVGIVDATGQVATDTFVVGTILVEE